jgi:hypothetical protein
MDQTDTHARVIVLASQGLGAEELAARCAGPNWDVAAYSDAYAAAADLLKPRPSLLVFDPAAIRPWQKSLIAMARRKGICVLACGGDGLAPAERQYVHIVNPDDLGEFITAGLAGNLEAPAQQAPPAPAAQPRPDQKNRVAQPTQGREDFSEPEERDEFEREDRGEPVTEQRGESEPENRRQAEDAAAQDEIRRKIAAEDYEETEAAFDTGAEEMPDASASAAPAIDDAAAAPDAGSKERTVPPEVSAGQVLTPEEIAALLKPTHE